MSKGRFVITGLAIFLLLGTISLAIGSTPSSETNPSNATVSILPINVSEKLTAPLPLAVSNLPDNRYNATLDSVMSYANGYNYAYLNYSNGTIQSHALVQLSPTAQLQSINMLTLLNSAYREGKLIEIYITNGYISSVDERFNNLSVMQTSPLSNGEYNNVTISAVYTIGDGRNYACINSQDNSTLVQLSPTSQLQSVNMINILDSAYWHHKFVNVYIINGYIESVSYSQ